MTKINNIAKNTSYYTFALILQKIISFTYFAMIARALGPEDLGKYYFALSFTTIFSIFIDIGLANVLTREVAKSREKIQELLNTVLSIKIPLAIFSFLLVFILINLLGYPELTRDLVYISSICMILDSFSLTFFAVSRGFHNLKFESIASVIFQLIIMALGLVTLYYNWGLKILMGGLAVASSFLVIYSAILLIKKWDMKIVPDFNFARIKWLIVVAIPFSMFAIFQKIYTYVDSVLLSVLVGDVQVGLYQVAFKIIFALQFLPMAFTASLYPAFSLYWVGNRSQLATTFERAMSYLIIISLPIAVGTIILADKIVLIFKSGYTDSVLPLQITMLSLPFLFLLFPIGSLLNACDRQKINTTVMGIGLSVSIILNLILMPIFKATGASTTAVVTNFLMFSMCMYWVPKIVRYDTKKVLIVFLKCLFAVGVMGGMVIYSKPYLNFFLIILLAGIVYFGILFILGAIKKNDIVSIWGSFLGEKK